MASGRKSLKEELDVLRRFEQLSPKVFGYISECLDSDIKEDKRWAMDWLKTGFAKLLPQTVKGDDDSPLVIKTIIINKNAGSNNQPATEADRSMGSV